VGLLICWDQWYPEAARLTALRGAQILFYPSAIGWYHREPAAERRRQQDAWQTMQRAHAIANGVFVAAINRVGVEGDLQFWGSSFVCDPGGVVLAQAPADQDHVLLADCDLTQIERTRQNWPFLRDRRIDAYQDLTRRYLDPRTTDGKGPVQSE
jgi:N-carbamoylputrescine amidase